jgi:hypothetical protein
MYRARIIKKHCIENNCMIRMFGGGKTQVGREKENHLNPLCKVRSTTSAVIVAWEGDVSSFKEWNIYHVNLTHKKVE